MLQLILQEQPTSLMTGPSHLQLASVMGERTADECVSFGKVKMENGTPQLTESNIDWLLDQYEREALLLLQDTVNRSRDKIQREMSKM